MKKKSLYLRDYTQLSREEEAAVANAEIFSQNTRIKGAPNFWSAGDIEKYHEILPQAYYFNRSYFPNNYLDKDILANCDYMQTLKKEALSLLDSKKNERDILNFINKNGHYCFIASITHTGFNFGHHDGSYLFKEFEITSTYKADYLLIGKNSGGYNFVFIELESPSGQITLGDGDLGLTFRKGIKQVQEWDAWIEANFNSLKLIFNKYKKDGVVLPEEFNALDKSRIHYAVIAGRRTDFNDKTYRIKRQYLQKYNIHLLHYDNLIDALDLAMSARNY